MVSSRSFSFFLRSTAAADMVVARVQGGDGDALPPPGSSWPSIWSEHRLGYVHIQE